MKISTSILAALITVAFLAPGIAQAKHPPAKKSYSVTVTDNSGDVFDDCFDFIDNTHMTIAGGDLEMAWEHRALGFSTERWQSVLSPPLFGLGFSGTVSWFGTRISGDGINDGGTTFIFTGHKVHSCPSDGGPYPYGY